MHFYFAKNTLSNVTMGHWDPKCPKVTHKGLTINKHGSDSIQNT